MGTRNAGSPLAVALALSLVAIPPAFAQKTPTQQEIQDAASQAQDQADLQQIQRNKSGYAAAIVARWQAAAQASGKWDQNSAADLLAALMRLGPENLLAAGRATSYEAMTTVVQQGSRAPSVFGDIADDLVYTPVDPCRIVDTRNAGGPLAGNTSRTFDVDGSTFIGQGGFDGSCGIPFGVARAVAMNITVTGPTGGGFLTVWGLGARPLASIINFVPGETIANSTIVPVVPGGGNDFSVFYGAIGSQFVDVVIDVLGFFAPPQATALQCNTQSSTFVSVLSGSTYSIVSPQCSTGFTVTGGGQATSTFSPLVSDSKVSGNGWQCQGTNTTGSTQTISCQAQCCRVPGR